jgi:hypothetical protein
MSRPAKQILYQPVDIDDADFIDLEPDARLESENAEFEKFKDEMHDADEYAKITVSRQPLDTRGRPLGKKLFQCFECGVEEYTFSQLCTRIREDFGTGLYKVQGRDSKGKYKFAKTIGVQAPKDESDERNPESVGSLIDKFSDAMERQQMRTEAMFTDINKTSMNNPMGMLTEMATAMATIMGQFGVNQQPQKTLLDQLTEYKMMQELFSGGNGSGGESNLFSLLTETVKSFGPALGMAIATQQQSGAIPMTGPVVAALSPPDKKETELSKELESMRPQIEFLLRQAKEGATAENVVTAIFPGIPEQSYESIEVFLQQENCLDLCAQVDPEVNKWRAWFAQWRDLMLARLDEIFSEAEPEPDHPAEPEIIGGEPLTIIPPGEQTSGAVAGDQSDTSISATAEPNADTSDSDEPTAGGGGNAGDA